MDLTVALTVLALIFLAELPDKTALASLVLGTRYRPLYVSVGAACAFTVHVGLAIAAESLLTLLPHRVLEAVVGALFLAGAVVPLSSSYAISEAIGVERSVSRRFREAPLFLGLFTFQIVLGAAVAMTPVNLISLLIGTQVLQGIITPVILIYILILTNRREVLGDAANKPAFRIAATICVGAISIMSLLLLGQTVLGWVGL